MSHESLKGILPTAKSIEELPLRAIVAYAARAARKLSVKLRGLIPDEVLDNVLDRTDQTYSSPFFSEIDISLLLHAVADLYGALGSLDDTPVDTFSDAHLAALCIARSATAGYFLVEAGADLMRANYHRARIVQKTELAVNSIASLCTGATTFREAAREDFELLVSEYGLHDKVIIGPPVDCFSEN